MRNRKITLIGINFYPEDSAIGLYSTDMIRHLESQGYKINVITGFPYYPQWKIKNEYSKKPTFFSEKLNEIKIYRYKQYVPNNPNFFKRIIHLLDFTFGSLINLFKVKETDIIISIVPFTSTIFLSWILKFRCRAQLWVHVQDFEFDAALQTGLANNKPNGFRRMIFYFLFKLEKWMFSKADRVSSISFSMLEKLKTKGVNPSKIFYLPNWINTAKINSNNFRRHRYLKSKKFKILYSGNIGDKQNWILFLDFISLLDVNKYEVVIVGDGSKKDWLTTNISKFNNISHYPPVAYDELSNLLCSADVHFLFQKEDVIDTVMPSKLLGMMASSKPSIVSGNEQSEVKKVLDESKGGFYITNADASKVLDVLNNLRNNKELRESIGNKARDFVVKNFSKEKILNNMSDVIREL